MQDFKNQFIRSEVYFHNSEPLLKIKLLERQPLQKLY